MGESGDMGPLQRADDMTQLRRFVCLGSELGRCSAEDQKLTVDNARCIMRLIEAGRGEEMVQEIVSFSSEGRAAKQKSLIFALAMCARLTNIREDENHMKTKRAAYAALDKVCRIPTDLFTFVRLCEKLTQNGTGWGRASRKAIASWYTGKEGHHLAYLVTKYVSREGWSHLDLLRLCHLKTDKEDVALVIKYMSKGFKAAKDECDKKGTVTDDTKRVLEYLSAVDRLKHTKDEQEAACVIREHHLVREHIPTWLYNSKEVWAALLEHMPMMALLRNLGKMSSLDLLGTGSIGSTLVIEKLNEKEALRKARIHPLHILTAIASYKKCKSEHKEMTWKTNPNIVIALDNAFYACFENVEPTNKRFLLALDVTNSMRYGQVTGNRQLTPAKAAAAMALLTARREPNYDIINFATEVKSVTLTADMDLTQVMGCIAEMPKGGADCAMPIKWALTNKKAYDVFIIYTDLEPYAGNESPAEMVKKYRQEMDIPNAKLIICALTSKGFSLADPEDRHMLDIAGLDSQTPAIIHQFVSDLML